MNLREQILKVHSKANSELIIKWIGNSPSRFNELLALFLHDEYRVVQRAAWSLAGAAINNPQLVAKHYGRLIKNLQKPPIHVAVTRNTVRLFAAIPVPEKFHGELMDICFRYIASSDETVAVKAFSLTILDRLSIPYPEIQNELKLVIEERWDHETAAFRSRAAKILKKIAAPRGRT